MSAKLKVYAKQAEIRLGSLDSFRGPQGPKGDKGETGERGPRGEAFTYADFTPEQLAALTGPQGPKGDPGDTGATGERGATGDTGATPNLTIGTVTTGAPGTDAAASIRGTAEDPVLDLTIPKGDTGSLGSLTVNGQAPDASGSVTLTPDDVGAVSTAVQSLTDAQKAQARENIGAGESSFSGSYEDLTHKPTIPSKVSELQNDSGYLTAAPVTKVNNKTGDVDVTELYESKKIGYITAMLAPDSNNTYWDSGFVITRASDHARMGTIYVRDNGTDQRLRAGYYHDGNWIKSVDIYDTAHQPPYPVTKVNNRTGAIIVDRLMRTSSGFSVILGGNADNYTLSAYSPENKAKSNLFLNASNGRLTFYYGYSDDGSTHETATVYTSKFPPPYPVTSVNGRTGAVETRVLASSSTNVTISVGGYMPLIDYPGRHIMYIGTNGYTNQSPFIMSWNDEGTLSGFRVAYFDDVITLTVAKFTGSNTNKKLTYVAGCDWNIFASGSINAVQNPNIKFLQLWAM